MTRQKTQDSNPDAPIKKQSSDDETRKKIDLIETKLIEQDHRLIPIATNFLTAFANRKEESAKFEAASRAAIFYFINPKTIVAGTATGAALALGIANLYLLYESNKIYT